MVSLRFCIHIFIMQHIVKEQKMFNVCINRGPEFTCYFNRYHMKKIDRFRFFLQLLFTWHLISNKKYLNQINIINFQYFVELTRQ